MNVTIRKAGVQDFPAVFILIKEFSAFQKTPEKVVITEEPMAKEKDVFRCLAAETEERGIAGFCTYFFAFLWSGKALYLNDLYVKKSFRKQGIGKKLLE